MKTSPYPIKTFSFLRKNFLGILKSRFRCAPRQRSKAFEFKPFWTVSAPFFTLVSAFWGTRFQLFGNALSTFWERAFHFLGSQFSKSGIRKTKFRNRKFEKRETRFWGTRCPRGVQRLVRSYDRTLRYMRPPMKKPAPPQIFQPDLRLT